jgi:hypothetical protein
MPWQSLCARHSWFRLTTNGAARIFPARSAESDDLIDTFGGDGWVGAVAFGRHSRGSL